jgi:hypothetical protein
VKRSKLSPPLASVRSNWTNAWRAGSNTACKRQSVPVLPGLEMQVASTSRSGRAIAGASSSPASSWPAIAISQSAAWRSRLCNAVSLSSATPACAAQAAVVCNDPCPLP